MSWTASEKMVSQCKWTWWTLTSESILDQLVGRNNKLRMLEMYSSFYRQNFCDYVRVASKKRNSLNRYSVKISLMLHPSKVRSLLRACSHLTKERDVFNIGHPWLPFASILNGVLVRIVLHKNEFDLHENYVLKCEDTHSTSICTSYEFSVPYLFNLFDTKQ